MSWWLIAGLVGDVLYLMSQPPAGYMLTLASHDSSVSSFVISSVPGCLLPSNKEWSGIKALELTVS